MSHSQRQVHSRLGMREFRDSPSWELARCGRGYALLETRGDRETPEGDSRAVWAPSRDAPVLGTPPKRWGGDSWRRPRLGGASTRAVRDRPWLTARRENRTSRRWVGRRACRPILGRGRDSPGIARGIGAPFLARGRARRVVRNTWRDIELPRGLSSMGVILPNDAKKPITQRFCYERKQNATRILLPR